MPDLWDEHDKGTFILNSSGWSHEYFLLITKDLKRNFSKERFEHFIKVGKFMRENKTSSINRKEIQRNLNSDKVPFKNANRTSNQLIENVEEFIKLLEQTLKKGVANLLDDEWDKNKTRSENTKKDPNSNKTN